MKTLFQNLLDFFHDHPNEIFDSGELQRMEWRNHRGKIVKPRTVVRYLQLLAADGKIKRIGDMRSSKYMIGDKPKPKFRYELDPITNVMKEIPYGN